MQRQPAVSQKREAEIMSRLARIASDIARIRQDEIREDSSVRQIRPMSRPKRSRRIRNLQLATPRESSRRPKTTPA